MSLFPNFFRGSSARIFGCRAFAAGPLPKSVTQRPSAAGVKTLPTETQRHCSAILLGCPGSGKSALFNRLVGGFNGAIYSPVSSRRHATSKVIEGFLTRDDSQVSLFDCPAIAPRDKRRFLLRERIVKAQLKQVDIAAIIVSGSKPSQDNLLKAKLHALLGEKNNPTTDGSPFVDMHAPKTGGSSSDSRVWKKILIFTKTDEVPKTHLPTLHSRVTQFKEFLQPSAVFLVNKTLKEETDRIRTFLLSQTKRDENWRVEKDVHADLSKKELVEFAVKNALLNLPLDKFLEIPFRAIVELVGWKEVNGRVHAEVLISVKDSGMAKRLIGLGGSNIEQIRTAAAQVLPLSKIDIRVRVESRKKSLADRLNEEKMKEDLQKMKQKLARMGH